MPRQLLAVEIRREHDVVLARQRARQIAELLGYDAQEQTRIATAASEVARNAFVHGRGGRVEFALDDVPSAALVITVVDQGPGIRDPGAILDGRTAPGGQAVTGLIAARRLMDGCDVQSREGRGTTVVLRKQFPRTAPPVTSQLASTIADSLARQAPRSPMEEVQQQNQELIRALEEARSRKVEVERLNRELEETNRGVLALYAELDDKAVDLKRASDLKSRFLSHMTHELRTPLNSIIMLARILLEGTEGELQPEQIKPVQLIRGSAESLLELVNDLLDLAKIEAGKTEVRLAPFALEDLFAALRGMFRPLLTGRNIDLVFEPPLPVPPLISDEGKLSQILRNFISNALKFTRSGQVTVRAEASPRNAITFSVADTGIGISEEDQRRLFQDFTQLGESDRVIKGSGLGLSLSKRLAELLGGSVAVRSVLGQGSVFSVTLPARFDMSPGKDHDAAPDAAPEAQHA